MVVKALQHPYPIHTKKAAKRLTKPQPNIFYCNIRWNNCQSKKHLLEFSSDCCFFIEKFGSTLTKSKGLKNNGDCGIRNLLTLTGKTLGLTLLNKNNKYMLVQIFWHNSISFLMHVWGVDAYPLPSFWHTSHSFTEVY